MNFEEKVQPEIHVKEDIEAEELTQEFKVEKSKDKEVVAAKRITADPLLKQVLRAFRNYLKNNYKSKFGKNYF